MTNIHLLIADDHQMVAEGLKNCLELYPTFEKISMVKDGNEALDYIEAHDPDIVLADVNMPNKCGLGLLRTLRQKEKAPKVIMLTMHSSDDYVQKSIKLGAKGYITKDVLSDEIEMAIRMVHKGGVYFSSNVADAALSKQNSENSGLTTAELIVLKQLANGAKSKEIAYNMEISPRTVETHRRNIRLKLDLSSSAEMVKYAIENGLD